MASKNIYLASDFHLGVPNHKQSLEREKKVVKWLDSIKHNASEIYIVGDIFDFWFEYKHVVPKGYVRFMSKIAELVEGGVKITFFTGNHDFWMKDYFEKELGVSVYKDCIIERSFYNQRFLIGHGDGVGPGDNRYKMMKKVFNFPLCRTLFSLLHPDLGIGLANYLSRKSRGVNHLTDKDYLGKDKEFIHIYCEELIKAGKQYDYFVFGHRHYPLEAKLSNGTTYFNLGDWIVNFTYLEISTKTVKLMKFE